MHSGPDVQRLREAYAVVDGIPDVQVTLDIEQLRMPPGTVTLGMADGRYLAPDQWDELVLTPDIWLSLCPACIDAVQPLIEHWEPYGIEVFWRIDGRRTSRFEIAMAHLFALTHEQAEDLFGMRSDDESGTQSDKQVFLDRIAGFLRGQGQDVQASPAHAPGHGAPPMRTGFGTLASQADAPGAETFDTEASASAVSPIVHEQSIGQDKRRAT